MCSTPDSKPHYLISPQSWEGGRAKFVDPTYAQLPVAYKELNDRWDSQMVSVLPLKEEELRDVKAGGLQSWTLMQDFPLKALLEHSRGVATGVTASGST